ncbi:hypothetical protein GCM10027061_21510 [Nesterenkonia suensis]
MIDPGETSCQAEHCCNGRDCQDAPSTIYPGPIVIKNNTGHPERIIRPQPRPQTREWDQPETD